EKLRGGPDVLGYRDFFQTGGDPQRIVLVFDDTTPLVPADVWVRDRAPGLVSRLTVATRAARALAWVHSRGLVHRRLSPEAILVSGASTDAPGQVRLCGFDLARDLATVTQTVTGSSLGDPSFRCIAPEALKTGEATTRSDLFSLGAAMFEILSGRPLFATPDAVLRPFTIAPFDVLGRPIPNDVLAIIADLVATDPFRRCAGADAAADALDAIIAKLTQTPKRNELEPGRTLRDVYELKRRLGRGATATTWLAENIQSSTTVVLKIASAAHARLLQEEHRIGIHVQHPNLVRVYNVEPFEDGNLLVLGFVDGVTAALWAGAGDPLDPARFKGVAVGLLSALDTLHEAGWLHRDVKPENVMLAEPSASPTLVDLGLACPVGAEGGLAVGTVQYKDPLVYSEGRWTTANDQFAAFIVLYELLTGTHPFGSSAPDGGQAPTVEPDQFPDSFPPAMAARLGLLFRRALSPFRGERPATIQEALHALDEAL
ncbi:MAG TPA: serine/threonine-protein kinase, partial [Myxococcota bacterium]|nr:serine/threonine-protein kinase [Myxococcota bacterium]